jgi:hypothetical protein
LHRWLDGPPGQEPSPARRVSPFACYLGYLCDQFPGRLPTEILAERDRLPAGFLDEILDSRHYRRAYDAWNQNPKVEGELVDLVKAITFEFVQEQMDSERDDG